MIKIIRGTYGFVDERGRVSPKTAASDPFGLPPENEKCLVTQGVAAYVAAAPQKTIAAEQEDEDRANNARSEDEKPDNGQEETPELPEYDLTMTRKQLDAIAEELGLDTSACKNKEAVIALLDEALEGIDDGETLPKFDIQGPIL